MVDDIKQITDHLVELRSHLLKILISVVAISVFILTFHLEPVDLYGVTLFYPTPDPFDNISSQMIHFMKEDLIPQRVDLIQTAPGQAFFAQLYVSVLLGLVFSMPVAVRELVGFIAPALQENEVKVIRSISLPAVGLFVAGVFFSYFVVTPYLIDFLYKYGESAELLTFLNIMDFISFVLQLFLAFGVSFQLPIVMYALTVSEITDSGLWRRNIRYAIIVIVIFGAVITPDGSGVTMWFVSGPMMGLYLVGMYIVERKASQSVATLKSSSGGEQVDA